MTPIIENPAPLQSDYVPETFVNRKEEEAGLQAAFADPGDTSLRNIHLYGSRGQGKTHFALSLLEDLPDRVNTCYIPCNQYDTQYKALQQIYQSVTQEEINNGYHTSDLKREIEERTGAVPTVVVLDEIDFALMNDGDSLLYFLSRIKNAENLSIITISANHQEPPVEERTRSSLQPQRISFPPYTGENVYEILLKRAKHSLANQSVQKEALTYIASTTDNIQYALTWLRKAAQQTENTITENQVKKLQSPAYQKYIQQLLQPFTPHHRQVFQSVQELVDERDSSSIRTGPIYERYNQLCHEHREEPLTERRISDFLKHLELLNIIEAKYHYGGKNGKTRDIQINSKHINLTPPKPRK